MSIEKLTDSSRTYVQRSPFTQIFNSVIDHIKDNDAFRVYAYLQSKSSDWKVIKTHLQKICGVGSRKMEYIFSYLNRAKLIRYVKVIDTSGKFSKFDVHVLNGTEFDQNEPFKTDKRQSPELSTEVQTTPAETAAAVNHSRGNAQLLNKEIQLNKEKQNKGDEQKINKPKQSSDTPQRIAPPPCTERTHPRRRFEKPKNELRCTAKEWGPGHETWERLHGSGETRHTERSNVNHSAPIGSGGIPSHG